MNWTAREYTDFALTHQLKSIWQIMTWAAAQLEACQVTCEPGEIILDLGAGPAITSHMLAVLTETRVEAVVQSKEYLRIAGDEGIPSALQRNDLVSLRCDPSFRLEDLPGRVKVVFSYACLHEIVAQEALLEHAFSLLPPGGLLIVIDTMQDALKDMEQAMDESGADLFKRQRILSTFRESLFLEQAEKLFRRICPGSRVSPLVLDDEVLIESEFNSPVDLPEGELINLEKPTLFYALARKSGSLTRE